MQGGAHISELPTLASAPPCARSHDLPRSRRVKAKIAVFTGVAFSRDCVSLINGSSPRWAIRHASRATTTPTTATPSSMSSSTARPRNDADPAFVLRRASSRRTGAL